MLLRKGAKPSPHCNVQHRLLALQLYRRQPAGLGEILLTMMYACFLG